MWELASPFRQLSIQSEICQIICAAPAVNRPVEQVCSTQLALACNTSLKSIIDRSIQSCGALLVVAPIFNARKSLLAAGF